MTQPSPEIHRFFQAFEQASDNGDIPALLPLFAETFAAASPQSVQCVRAADFALALPRRKQFFDSLGCKSTTLVGLEEIRLGGSFVIAKTRWRMTFEQPGRGTAKEAFADSVFIVDSSSDQIRIVFYLSIQDHLTMLRQHGILPN